MITFYYFGVLVIAIYKTVRAIIKMIPNKKRDEKLEEMYDSATKNFEMSIDESIDARERMERSFNFTSKIPRIKWSFIQDVWIFLGLFSRYSRLFWVYWFLFLLGISMIMFDMTGRLPMTSKQRKAMGVVIPLSEAIILFFIANKYFNFV